MKMVLAHKTLSEFKEGKFCAFEHNRYKFYEVS
jgi:hypothetical protein